MATIINSPERERVVEVDRSSDNSSGWAVALIILIIAIAIGVWAYARYHNSAAPQSPGTSNGGANINVTLPGGTQGTTQGTNGAGSGTNQ